MDFTRFIKFGLVGFSGLLVDFLITYICKEQLKCNQYLANGFGFIFGVTNNFVLNRIFTFQSTDSAVSKQFISFFVIATIGFIINSLFIFLYQKHIKKNFYVAKILAVIVVFVWNFAANSILTF